MKILPLHCDLPASQVFELVQVAALEMPRWEIAAVEPGRFLVEVVASSRLPLLPFLREDVVIQVRTQSGGCGVHMRCKARLGKGVMGGQARLIRGFLKKLQAKLRELDK